MTGAGFEGPLLNECGYNVTKITEAPLTAAIPMLNPGGGGPIAEKRMYFFLWEKKCWLLHEVAEQTFHVFHDFVVLEKDSILSHPPALPPTAPTSGPPPPPQNTGDRRIGTGVKLMNRWIN